MIVRDDRIALSRAALSSAGLTLLLMGAMAAAYGPLLPYLMRRFAIGVSVAGLVFGVHFAGGLLGVTASMLSLGRLTSRVAVSGALGLMAIGCIGVALALSWLVMLAGVFLIGIGFGALDLRINQMLAYSVNPKRVALLNGLNGVFGIGAVAAPILVSIAGARYGLIYAGGAAVAAVALLGFRGVPGRLRGASSSGTAPSSRRTARLVVIFATAFGLYVGVEIGVAGWMPTHLHSAGFGLAAAATLTSGFWLALAAGRFLVAPLTLRVSDSAIVLGGTAVAVLCLAGALIAPFAPVAYIATGLAIAPVFPTGVAWLATLNPANPGATSWLFPASMVGGALIPSAIVLVIARVGAGWVPTILAAVAIGTLAAFAAAARCSTRLN